MKRDRRYVRLLLLALVLNGFAAGVIFEKVLDKGLNAGVVFWAILIVVAMIWAASSIELEFESAKRSARFYRKQNKRIRKQLRKSFYQS